MDLMVFDIFIKLKTHFPGFLSLNYIPNINKIRSNGDSSVLIMQSYQYDLSEATLLHRFFFVSLLICVCLHINARKSIVICILAIFIWHRGPTYFFKPRVIIDSKDVLAVNN